MSRVVVESSHPFVFAATCAYIDTLNPTGAASVLALRPREPDHVLFTLAREEGCVEFGGAVITYRVVSSEPLPSENKPEPFRELVLTTRAARSVVLDLISRAIDHHRRVVTAPRGQPGTGVMRYVWDEDSQCWDSGKLVTHRSMDTLFLPPGTAEDLVGDLQKFLRSDTLDTYVALHISPVRVYMLHGLPGGGKSTMVHCAASETGHNLAVLNFRHHTTDQDVVAAIRNLPPKCFLCIEDVDCLFDARANKNHGVSFASLLSALDGAYDALTGAPLTVFMTSNALERLDQALRRRVDYAVEFVWATKQQCKRMFEAFYPHNPGFEALWAQINRTKFSTSVMHKFLVRSLHSNDALGCVDSFHALVACAYGPTSTHSIYM